MAASDARPFPLKNTAYRVTFPIFDADGDLVTGAASLDTELSGDGGTFADATNEATEIATSSGMYYLDLTAGEMNYDTVAIIVKTSTSGAKTTPIVLYPVEATDIPVNVKAISDDTTSADNLESYTDGTTPAPVNVTQISGDSGAADNLEAACDGGTYNVGGGAVVAASVTGAVGSVTGAVGSVTAEVSANVTKISGDGTAADNAEAFFDGTGYAGTNNVIPTVTTLTGHTAQTGDAYARLGAPAGASVSADIAAVKAQTAAIETDTQDLQTQIGTDGAGLTNMPWNAAWDAGELVRRRREREKGGGGEGETGGEGREGEIRRTDDGVD